MQKGLRLSFRISKEQKKALDFYAALYGITTSEYIRKAISAYIAQGFKK